MSTSRGPAPNGQRPPAVHMADAAFERIMSEMDEVAPATTGVPQMSQRVGEVLAELTRTRGGQPLRAAVARSLDTFSDLVAEMTAAFAEVVDTTLRSVDAGGAAQPDQPVALAGPPGGRARATVWIHTTAGAPAEVVSLRLTDLTAHDGTVLPGSSASFVTSTTPAASTTRASAQIEVAIPTGLATGVYHGHVLAAGVPDAALPVRLRVER